MTTTSKKGYDKSNRISRRELLKHMACGGLALTGAGTVLSACAPDPIQAEEQSGTPAAAWAPSFYLPTDEGMWTPPVTNTGDLPTGTGTVEIERVGKFSFEAEQVTTMRPDTPISLRCRRRARIGKNPLSHNAGIGGETDWLRCYLYLENQVA